MSPRTSKQFEAIREEKISLIMDTALELFAGEGFHATTITHIAKHAGISKGLMYNYFSSKEELLTAIIKKSVKEFYDSFDIDKDGFLTEKEFEFFIIRTGQLLREKKMIWRLFFRLLMQNDVREQFIKAFSSQESLINKSQIENDGFSLTDIMKTITEYFIRKKETKEEGYDPILDLNMFVITLKGLSLTYVYSDEYDEVYFEKTIKRIIELFK